MEKQWYRFWKKSGPNGMPDETYELFEGGHNDETWVEDRLEDWAGRAGGGFNTHYSYGADEVEVPPKEWLAEELDGHKKSVKYHRKQAKYIKSLL